jgi:hypothetical protein
MLTVRGYGEGYGTYCHFQQYFSYIVALVLLVEYPDKTTDLLQVTDKLYYKVV